jgi:hypothetical protein
MESKRSSGNCVCANRIAGDAAGRGWNADPLEQEYRRVAPGEQYFAGSFSESGLARLRRIWGVYKVESVKTLQTSDAAIQRAFDVLSL